LSSSFHSDSSDSSFSISLIYFPLSSVGFCGYNKGNPQIQPLLAYEQDSHQSSSHCSADLVHGILILCTSCRVCLLVGPVHVQLVVDRAALGLVIHRALRFPLSLSVLRTLHSHVVHLLPTLVSNIKRLCSCQRSQLSSS
jgi:hypothetical protein